MKIKCPFCEYKMTTKRESVYIICTLCKKTILISKYFPGRKTDINEINEYHYNLVTTIPFNPYLKDPSDPLYLPRESEYSIYEEKGKFMETYKQKKLQSQNIPKKFDVYKPVLDTINEITNNIKTMGYYPDKYNYIKPNLSTDYHYI